MQRPLTTCWLPHGNTVLATNETCGGADNINKSRFHNLHKNETNSDGGSIANASACTTLATLLLNATAFLTCVGVYARQFHRRFSCLRHATYVARVCVCVEERALRCKPHLEQQQPTKVHCEHTPHYSNNNVLQQCNNANQRRIRPHNIATTRRCRIVSYSARPFYFHLGRAVVADIFVFANFAVAVLSTMRALWETQTPGGIFHSCRTV